MKVVKKLIENFDKMFSCVLINKILLCINKNIFMKNVEKWYCIDIVRYCNFAMVVINIILKYSLIL